MKMIGKYHGIDCYECSENEYNRDRDDGSCIFIIDGIMVKNNIIIGYYDGKTVVEGCGSLPFRVSPVEKTEVKNAEEPKTANIAPEIRYSDYSTVVDEFFKNL